MPRPSVAPDRPGTPPPHLTAAPHLLHRTVDPPSAAPLGKSYVPTKALRSSKLGEPNTWKNLPISAPDPACRQVAPGLTTPATPAKNHRPDYMYIDGTPSPARTPKRLTALNHLRCPARAFKLG